MSKVYALDLKEELFGGQEAEAIAANPTKFISSILPNVFVAAGLILLVYLIAGGFMVITAANDPDQAKKGQQAMTNAIMGFLIIFASYWIIQIIQVVTGIPILTGYTG